MVVAARLKMGWISEDDLVSGDEDAEEQAEEAAEA
jgi:hypothetical protein